VEVYLDGGVRSGIDVFKAVAMGARGVLLGRAWAWALAGAGASGLGDLLTTMRHELEVAMALAGVNTLAEITRDQVDVTEPR
jgi:L-lactate dehydrogenase (cytochrome)